MTKGGLSKEARHILNQLKKERMGPQPDFSVYDNSSNIRESDNPNLTKYDKRIIGKELVNLYLAGQGDQHGEPLEENSREVLQEIGAKFEIPEVVTKIILKSARSYAPIEYGNVCSSAIKHLYEHGDKLEAKKLAMQYAQLVKRREYDEEGKTLQRRTNALVAAKQIYRSAGLEAKAKEIEKMPNGNRGPMTDAELSAKWVGLLNRFASEQGGFAAAIMIAGGLFFLSSNITGNAIVNVSQSSGNILGAVLLMVGLIAGFFWVKKK